MKKTCTASIHTLGCKLNQAESEALARELSGKGFTLITGNRADAFIINSCSVTHMSDRKSRHLVRLLRSLNPQSTIAVTGCYAEWAKEELVKCGADLVCGNAEKNSLAGLLVTGQHKKRFNPCARQAGRVRSFIKIQDGCNMFCSYCIVPFVRPTLHTVDADRVIKQIRSRASGGYREIVLTGTEIGSYSSNGLKLTDLIELILRETSVERLHLSSLQPQEITRDLIGLWQDRRLCRHFHMALQSGSDVVLQRMGRPYTTVTFRKAVEMLRAELPDASVTTDIMVGFPGESEQEFDESYQFCLRMKFATLHIFPFSARPGTLAAKMPGRIGEEVKKQRSSIMLELAARSADEFVQRFTGQTRDVLWEKEVRRGSDIYSGLTDNYIRTYTRSGRDVTNTISEVRLTGPDGNPGPPFIAGFTRRTHGSLWGELPA